MNKLRKPTSKTGSLIAAIAPDNYENCYIYPRAYLRGQNISDSEIDCLANLCFLSASENKKIGKKKPSEYISLMPGGEILKNILSSSFCPEDTFNDDFSGFLDKRAAALTSFSQELIRSSN